eukprot:gene2463-3045_t
MLLSKLSSTIIKRSITSSSSTSNKQQQQNIQQQQPEQQQQPQQQQQQEQENKSCWCLLSCKLEGKRISTSKIKPIAYDDDKGYILGDYNANYEEKPLSICRSNVTTELIKNKDQFLQEQQEEAEEERLEKEKQQENKKTRQLFQSEEEKQDENREFPVLNDDNTSIGPVHILYKNEWIITIVERIETDNKDNEPYFVLKFKTPIRLTNDVSFSIESLSTFSTLEKLFSFSKSVECGDKEFERLFLTKSQSNSTKQETKWLMEQRPYLREALIGLRVHLLPSLGFNNCGINLELKKESKVGCKKGISELEFPKGTYQLCLEIDNNESIWLKSPESVEKILYLYTVIFDSIVSIGDTDDSPLPISYL